ncbi:MAG: hypothetical protein ACLFV6_11480 [Spirulinaceae cyanobacterium]
MTRSQRLDAIKLLHLSRGIHLTNGIISALEADKDHPREVFA